MLEPTEKIDNKSSGAAAATTEKDKTESPGFVKKVVKSVRKYLPRHAKVWKKVLPTFPLRNRNTPLLLFRNLSHLCISLFLLRRSRKLKRR